MPEPHEPRPPPPKRARWFIYTDASSLGIEIAVAVTMGAIGGYYVERYLTHWSPWTMLIGFGLGIVVAVKAVLRTARAYQAALRRDATEEARARAEADADANPRPAQVRKA
jgi:F0F1-type ATP synthase assembly protein I